MSSTVRTYVILFFLGLAATLPYWGCYHDMDDEAAVAVLGATRLLDGELPYRDWTTRHTPGTFFVTAAYFLIFGSGQLPTRSLMALVSSLSGLFIFGCSQRVVTGRLSYLPWLLWTCGSVYEKRGLNHHWFGALSTLVVAYFTLRWALERQPRAAFWVGASAAVSSWFLQSNGLSSLLMVVLISIRLRPPGVVKAGAAYLATQLLLWLPWLPLASQVWSNHVTVLQRHILFNWQPYSWRYLSDLAAGFSWLDPAQQPVHFLAAWSDFFRLIPQYALYYPIIALSLVWAERAKDRRLIALAYCCLAWGLTTGYCQAPDYLSYAAPAYQLALLPLLARPWRAREALLWVWAALEVLGWTFRAWSIGIAYVYPVKTRVGDYWTHDPQQSQSLNRLYLWVQEHCPAGTKVLAYPYFTSLYTMQQLRNPIQQPILVPWLFEDREFDDCLKVLDQQQIRFIFHRALSMQSIHTAYPAAPMKEFEEEYKKQSARIFAHYRLVWRDDVYEIYERQP